MSITNPTEGKQLLAKAIRDSQRVDTIGDTVSFTMKVLSMPVPKSTKDVEAVFGAPEDGSVSFFDDAPKVEDRLQFKGRIEGEYFMSPHMAIPDPCNIYGASNALIAAYQSLHTTCITPKGFSESLKIGDRVRVTCRKGDYKMDLQFANVDSLETSQPAEISETDIQECQVLKSRFEGATDFLENLRGSDISPGSQTGLGPTVTAPSEDLGLGPIMQRIKDGDPTLWPAKVLNIDGQPEINQMYAACTLGQWITSRPQTARSITVYDSKTQKRVKKTSLHAGVDLGIGSGTPLYACFPGVVQRNTSGGKQPFTTSYAKLTITSKLEFADGETAEIIVVYGHVSRYVDLPDGTNIAIDPNNPDASVKVAYSGGNKDQVGSGGTTGAHLHWEIKEDGRFQGTHMVYRGHIKDPTTGEYGGMTPEASEVLKWIGYTTGPADGTTPYDGSEFTGPELPPLTTAGAIESSYGPAIGRYTQLDLTGYGITDSTENSEISDSLITNSSFKYTVSDVIEPLDATVVTGQDFTIGIWDTTTETSTDE